jgi:hypothetical protein
MAIFESLSAQFSGSIFFRQLHPRLEPPSRRTCPSTCNVLYNEHTCIFAGPHQRGRGALDAWCSKRETIPQWLSVWKPGIANLLAPYCYPNPGRASLSSSVHRYGQRTHPSPPTWVPVGAAVAPPAKMAKRLHRTRWTSCRSISYMKDDLAHAQGMGRLPRALQEP